MKTKERIIKMMLVLVAMTMGMKAMAQEAYTVFDGNKLTFYYDSKKSSRQGLVFALNNNKDYPLWAKYSDYIKSVEFDSSFANARPTSTCNWFYGMNNLKSIINMKEYLNTCEVTIMMSMFQDCEILTSLDVSNFNTAKVTDMSQMFQDCESLTSLDVSNFNTANVTTMFQMFCDCNSLLSLDLSNFNTVNVTDMHGMFLLCYNLTSLDVSSFNTGKVMNMSEMFNICSSLTSLDLSSFNTANVKSMKKMFNNNTKLVTIYVGDEWNTDNVIYYEDMFYYCQNLVGAAGTEYSSCHIDDVTYAHVDGGSSNPGYFTYKAISKYFLWIAGKQVTVNNQDNVLGDGKVSYNPSTKTLTLNNATIKNNNGIGIRDFGTSGLIIEVRGKNTIEALTNPMSFSVSATIRDYDDSGENELVLTGLLPVTFKESLAFRNRYTLLNTSSSLLEGTGDASSLTFGGGTTFCGTGEMNSNGVRNVTALTVESGSQLLGTDQNQTVTFDTTQQTVLQNGTSMKGILFVGQYFPLWLDDVQLSTALVRVLNQVYSQFNGDAFNLDVRSVNNGLFETVEMKARIPHYGFALRSKAPYLTIELTGDCTFETDVTDKPAMQLNGYTTVKGTGKLTVKSENGVGITNSGNALYINDVDIDIYGAKGGVNDVLSLFPTSVEGTISSGDGYYCVSETKNFIMSDCYILNNVLFNSSIKRINSTVLKIGREKKTIATDISEPVTQPTTQDQPMYNVAGQRVGNDYKGIVIQNGKKTVVK